MKVAGTLTQLAGRPLWAKRKTDFSQDRQLVSGPGQSLASHQVGDQLIHEVSSRGPAGTGSICAHSFPFLQGEAMRGDLPQGLLEGSREPGKS